MNVIRVFYICCIDQGQRHYRVFNLIIGEEKNPEAGIRNRIKHKIIVNWEMATRHTEVT